MLDTLLGGIAEATIQASNDDRELHLARPSRSVSSIREAIVPPRGFAAFAACVEKRESGGNPNVLNHGGSGAQGLFQFMPSWNHGGPYMVKDRLEDHGMSHRQARAVRIFLSARPIVRWPALYQRILFAEAVDRGGALKHWSGHTCNVLVP
jgi:hypothetical protein